MKQPVSNYDLQVDIGKQIFLQYDQERLIRKFCLEADERWIYLIYLGTPCRIDRGDGTIEEFAQGVWRECRSYSTVMTIYDLLCFHKGETPPPLFDRWCTVGTFVITGVTQTDTFTKEYAALFNGHYRAYRLSCRGRGTCPALRRACRFRDHSAVFFTRPACFALPLCQARC